MVCNVVLLFNFQAFCANKRLPPQLARAIMTHSTYFWKRNFVYDDLDILQVLNPNDFLSVSLLLNHIIHLGVCN